MKNLTVMRSQYADLKTRADAKIAEAKDGMPAADVKRIEEEHAELVRAMGQLSEEIAQEERRLAVSTSKSSAHAWTGDEISKIMARAKAFGLTSDDAAAVMADSTVRSLDAATDKLQDMATAGNSNRQLPHIQITQDEGDTIRQAVTASIVLRANPQGLPANAPEREMARNYRGMSLLEAGRVFTEETQGVKLRGLSKRELATVLLGMEKRAGMLSNSDFANVLANVASKRLRDAYQAAPQNWKLISRQSNNPDFKSKSVVQLSNLPTFTKVREGEEYSYASLSDGVESYALATYGKIVAITRQTLINDDLGAFDRLPMLLGRAAAELEASVFWAILTTNAGAGATMADGKNIFDAASHKNYTTAGTAISVDSLDVGRAAMRTQVGFGASAQPLNLAPRFLVVSPAKETKAQQFIASITATKGSDVNPFANSLVQITEARLSGNAWYLVADPATIDTIEYAYLEGEEGLYTEQRIGFEIDGIEIKGRLDFAAKAIDYRGFYKNAGA